MMKTSTIVLVIGLFYVVNADLSSVNGGVDCATCTVFVGLVEKLATVYNESIVSSLERLCNYMPVEIKGYCRIAIEYLGPIIIDGLVRKESPDDVCHTLKFCRNDPGQSECRLFPKRKSSRSYGSADSKASICDLPGMKEICDLLNKVFNNHLPLIDLDGDRFSSEPTMRGSSWRGKDCNDMSSKIRPGSHIVNGDVPIDYNCNGIFGLNSATGRSWEEDLCNETERIGIAVLGDSLSAHFHIPEQWLDARQFSSAVFEHMWFIIENEFDWPQLSTSTGHLNISWPNIQGSVYQSLRIHLSHADLCFLGPTRSLYSRLFSLDHCNHRDYQNIAVNGARTGAMIDIVKTLTRDPKRDVPLLVLYAVVGNDVCNGHPDTIDHMTKYDEMYTNVRTALMYLDTVLPKGSHVLTAGLINGSHFYEYLHDRIHPFGRVGPPITYTDVYSYLSCLQISPCNGWLTSNDTLRTLTTQRAVELSEAVRNASFSFTPKNYDIDYFEYPFSEVFQKWIEEGGEGWQLIEGVDGFHLNQFGHAAVSDAIWSWLETNKPQWLPKANPRNEDIENVFKDQGGY
ncbi:unnamed protein product [Adineta ricciae]|uniref:Saposin B-type domain-containing protein n=1 Tax=Adineta ricciae TaxID=249248 RepID=A0A816EG97_ADIRI|nr:unnamed protein product [Adineta ricciae]